MPDEYKLPDDDTDETEVVPPSRPVDIEFTPAERRRPVNPDDDIPFHLPKADEDAVAPKHQERKRDAQSMPTMPIPREPGTTD
jgi:hypothetical protein